MSKSRYLRISASVLAGLALAACASTSGASSDRDAAEASEFAKPSAEDIELIARAEPIAQVNYWNQQYNLHPVDEEIALYFIRSLRQISSFERAAEVANLAVVSHPQSADLFVELGRASASQGKSREALRAFGRALNINSDDPYPFAAIGIILDKEGQHENAQAAYTEALVRNPDRTSTLSNYGLSLALTGKLSEAEEQLRKAVDLPDASVKVRQNFALILGLQGKFDEARAIAAKDAPNGIAERNADFLAQMIGSNAKLQAISDVVASRDAPKPAPSEPIQSVALGEPGSNTERTAQPVPSPATIAQNTPKETAPRRRRARRSNLITGGSD